MVIIRVLLRIAQVAAIAVTSLASAAESVNVNSVELAVSCRSPGIIDGGYVVEIRPGSSPETARVSIGADSLGGVHFIETYDVSVTPSGSGTLFEGSHPSPYARRRGGRQSRETMPDHLTLTLSEGRPLSWDDSKIEYDATFTAEFFGRTHVDRLRCGSLRSQAPPVR